MDNGVNDNQQVDLPGIQDWLERGKKLGLDVRAWIDEGKQYWPQLVELFDLVKETDFLKTIQKAREDMIVDDMLHQAGLLKPPGDANGEEVQD